MEKCRCEGSIYPDSMCTLCLKAIEAKLLKKIEEYEEKVSDLESDLNQVQYFLYDEPPEERESAS